MIIIQQYVRFARKAGDNSSLHRTNYIDITNFMLF